MLRRGQQTHAAHFREPQSGLDIQCRENGFHRDGVGREFLNQSTDQAVNSLERSAGRFLAFFADVQGAVAQNAAFAAFGFYDAVARWTCRGRINAEHANASRIAGIEHGSKSKAYEKWTQRSWEKKKLRK